MGKLKNFLNSKIVRSDVGEETVLTWKETLSYALGRGAQGMSTSTMSSGNVNYFLTNLMGLSLPFVSAVRFWTGLWDAFNDPIMGVLVDKTHTKDGKMLPYIKWAPYLCALFTFGVFLNSSSFPMILRMIFAVVALVGWDMTYTAFDIPMGALAFSITSSGVERTKLFGVSSIVRAVVGAIPGAVLPIALLIPYFKVHTGYAYTATAVIAFFGIILCTRPTYRNCHERAEHNNNEPTIKECFALLLKNKPLFMLFLSNMAFLLVTVKTAVQMYFAVDLMGDAAYVTILSVALAPAPFIAGVLVPFITEKLGERADFKKMYIACCVLAALLHGLFYVTTSGSLLHLQTGEKPTVPIIILVLLFVVLTSIPLEFKNLLSKEMEAETVDYVEWKTGTRAEGIMLSLMSFTGKLTNSVSSTIGLAVLGLANYATHENAVAVAQTFTAKNALLSCMTLIPMGGYILMLLPILFYSISRKQHTQMMAEIAARKAATHE
ncbi:MAG: MFS transporter [Acutalibacteraceae bacterium]